MDRAVGKGVSQTRGQFMASIKFSGTTEITSEGIKKHFRTIEPIQAVFELVWNGFDAKASEVSVAISYSELGTPTTITVSDDGEGIDFKNHEQNFGRFNDSVKKDDFDQHGSHGRGRLAFHRLAHDATWYTKTAEGEAVLEVNGSDLKSFEGRSLEPADNHRRVLSSMGTVVELRNILVNIPEREALFKAFACEFGWYLAVNTDKRLVVNDEEIAVPSHVLHEEVIHVADTTFDVKVFRWIERPTSEKSFSYLINSAGRIVYRQLSTLNNKPNFFTSIFIQSDWADSFSEAGGLFSPRNPDSEEWRAVSKAVTGISRKIYEDFLRQFVDEELARFEDDGTFPSYPGLPAEYANWRHMNTKEIVRSIYTADPAVFSSLSKKQRKILVRLLDKLSVSNENEALFEVLSAVLDLDPASVNTLAEQLNRTTLENIISTIELLQRRQIAVDELRQLMNVHYAEVTETPDLQSIIENNTWLFGARYEILGAEEDTFTRIAKSLRDSLKGIDGVESEDVEGDATVEGANRQPDLFLARKVLSFDSFGQQIYRCIIIEIKKPSISLNVKHLRQLDDYAAIIKRHPQFSSDRMHFELILVGRKISDADTEIDTRLKQQLVSGEAGLYSVEPRMRRYVMNWYTLLDGFEIANSALLERLKLKRDELAGVGKDDLVEKLRVDNALSIP